MTDLKILGLNLVNYSDVEGINNELSSVIRGLYVDDNGELSERGTHQLSEIFFGPKSLEQLQDGPISRDNSIFFIDGVSYLASVSKFKSELLDYCVRISSRIRRPILTRDLLEIIMANPTVRLIIDRRVKSLQKHMIWQAFFKIFGPEISRKNIPRVALMSNVLSTIVRVDGSKIVGIIEDCPTSRVAIYPGHTWMSLEEWMMKFTDYGKLLRGCKFQFLSSILETQHTSEPILLQMRESMGALLNNYISIVGVSVLIYRTVHLQMTNRDLESSKLISNMMDSSIIPYISFGVRNFNLPQESSNSDSSVHSEIPDVRVVTIDRNFIERELTINPVLVDIVDKIKFHVRVQAVIRYVERIRTKLRTLNPQDRGLRWWGWVGAYLGRCLISGIYSNLELVSLKSDAELDNWIAETRTARFEGRELNRGVPELISAIASIDTGLVRIGLLKYYHTPDARMTRNCYRSILTTIYHNVKKEQDIGPYVNLDKGIEPSLIRGMLGPIPNKLEDERTRCIRMDIARKIYLCCVCGRDEFKDLDLYWCQQMIKSHNCLLHQLLPLFCCFGDPGSSIENLKLDNIHLSIRSDRFKINTNIRNVLSIVRDINDKIRAATAITQL